MHIKWYYFLKMFYSALIMRFFGKKLKNMMLETLENVIKKKYFLKKKFPSF